MKNAREVLQKAEQLVQFLEKNNYEEPNFTPKSKKIPTDNEYAAIRTPLNQALDNLDHLVNGPTNWLRQFFTSHHVLAAWQVALRLKFFEAVPLDTSITLTELSKKVTMDEDRLSRIMKLLTNQYCFNEVEEGLFEHTAMSAQLAQDKELDAVIAMQ